MPDSAWVLDADGHQPTFLVQLRRTSDLIPWGLAWSCNGVVARRLLIASVSESSAAGQASTCSLQRGAELLSVNGISEHDDMRRELNEALEVELLFRSAAESPPTLAPSRSTLRAIGSRPYGVAGPTSSKRRAQSEAPSIKVRVKNTFLHFSQSGDADIASSTSPTFRSPYMQGCLAGLDLPPAALSAGWVSDPSNRWASDSDGATSSDKNLSNGPESYPSTDWEYSAYHHSPLQVPLSGAQMMYPVQAQGLAVWPCPNTQVDCNDSTINIDNMQRLLMRPRDLSPGVASSSSEDVAQTPPGQITERTSSQPRGLSHSDPERSGKSDNSEAARSEAGPPPKSMAKLWESKLWESKLKPDDPQSSMDESTTYCSTIFEQQKKVRRGGKRMHRPCHIKAKQEQEQLAAEYHRQLAEQEQANPDIKNTEDAESRRTFYPSLSKEDLEAHLKSHAAKAFTNKVHVLSLNADESKAQPTEATVPTPPREASAPKKARSPTPPAEERRGRKDSPTEAAVQIAGGWRRRERLSATPPKQGEGLVKELESPAPLDIVETKAEQGQHPLQGHRPRSVSKQVAHPPSKEECSSSVHGQPQKDTPVAEAAEPKVEAVVTPETQHCNQSDSAKETCSEASVEVDEHMPLDLVGKQVLVQGLLRMPEFNGDCGQVLAYDEESQRYKVSLERPDGPPVIAKLRRQNLIPDTGEAILAEEKAITGFADSCAVVCSPVAEIPVPAPTLSHTEPVAITTLSHKEQQPQLPEEQLQETHQVNAVSIRRATLRRTSRQRAAADAPLDNQKVPATSSTCTMEARSSSQIRKQPSSPATPAKPQLSSTVSPETSTPKPRRQLSSSPATNTGQPALSARGAENAVRPLRRAVSSKTVRRTVSSTPDERSASQLPSSARQLRQPSCPVASVRQPATSSLDDRDGTAPHLSRGRSSSARAARPKTNEKPRPKTSTTSEKKPGSDTKILAHAVVSNSQSDGQVTQKAPASFADSHADVATSRKVETTSSATGSTVAVRRVRRGSSIGTRAATVTSTPEASNSATSITPDAAPPCAAPLPPAPNQKTGASGRAAVTPATKKVLKKVAVPAEAPAAATVTSQDDRKGTASQDDKKGAGAEAAVVGKWQRHRVAREVQTPDQKDGSDASTDTPIVHSPQPSSASEHRHVQASSSQGANVDVVAKEGSLASNEWRPSLRLRK